ncbi:MAG TPA: OmpA family protein [Alphaproteobacteria bacterium]|jgi:OOP family OmpA-OmpF porin|nr:OmpA family protein [Alphaproteobacteria bacterium]
MRISLAAGIVAAGLLAAAGAASAQDSGPYLGLGLGASFLEDHSFNGTGIASKGEYDTGMGGLLTFGYRFDPNWRGEIEGGYRRNGISSNSPGTGDGSSQAFTGMLNVLYDIRTGTSFTPYLGVGGGWVHYKAAGMTPVAGQRLNDNDNLWGLQGIAGVSYDLSPRTQLFLDYHYLRAQNPNVTTSTGTSVNTKYRDHLVTVGFRFLIGAPPAPAAAPAPAPAPVAAPAPAPAPAPVVRSFQVFFDFDKADVRPDARPIIEEAANNARRGGVSRIVLTGHTDKAGSAAYNQRLSVRRAEAVKAEFVRMGFNPNDIQTIGKGKTDPLVPTADGVREPKNRRVEIVF